MGKSAMCIKMLQILNTGRIYKISELAGLLETNPRNIIEYKKELEECGYYLNTIPGRYGGYQLEKSVTIPSLHLSPNEVRSLDLGLEYLSKRNDFFSKDEYTRAISKVYSTINKNLVDDDILIINRFPLSMKKEDLKFRFDLIYDCIRDRKCLKLSYVSQKNEEHEYIYHPYELFMYNNAWFVIGWNESYNAVIYFKLNRITKIERTNKSFNVAKFYKRSDYVDEDGFVSNDNDYYHLKFIAKGINAMLAKERIYGKNQVLQVLDINNTLVECDMKNKGAILDFFLGFRENVEIIEPERVKDDLRKFGEYLTDKYIN